MIDPLYSYQADAIRRIARGEQLYLGFDPGLGKSRTALEAALQRGARRILIICQASGRYVWEREVKKWGGSGVTMIRGMVDIKRLQNDGVVVITYGLLSIKDSPFANAIAKGNPYDLTVLDEAAAVKNSGANRTKAILGAMLPKLGYLLPLSGTPAPNHAGELYSILKAVYPSAITSASGSPMQQWQFEDTFCRVVNKRFGNGPSIRVIEGSKNIPELRRRMDGFMVRVRKEVVLKDLPSVRYDIVPIDVERQAIMHVPSVPADLKDDDLLKYLSGSTDEHVMRIRRLLGLAKSLPAVEYIDDFLTNLDPYKKLLVFAHHREVIERLMSNLQNWHPVSIVGATTPNDRTKAVDTFLSDHRCRLFIGNIAASGTGLTLVGPTCRCSDVVFVEASYSVGENVQAAARVHRIGQHEAVVARFLTAHGSIDDRISEILARKAQDFAGLFN